MAEGKAEVLYSYDPVVQEKPFSLEAIMNIQNYNYKTFVKAYKEERKEILDKEAQDMRMLAVWSFFKNVRKDDLMLFVHGNEIDGYYVITGEHVVCQNEEDFCLHIWEAETIRFGQPVCIARRFGPPFFKIIGDFKRDVVDALRKAIQS